MNSKLYLRLYRKFKASGETVRVYQENRLIFSSDKPGMQPLLEYLESEVHCGKRPIIFDKIVGNASALLCVRAGAHEVYCPLGSRIAAKTLSCFSVNYYFEKMVPYITIASGKDMCPMERLSLYKDPAGFQTALKEFIASGHNLKPG